jgi:hypothetical protein
MISLFYVLMKGSIMSYIGLSVFDVDLVIIIIIFLLFMEAETGAGVFALSQGLLIDIFSGGPVGLFTLLYLTVFLSIHLGSRFLDLRAVRGQVTVILLAVLLKGGLLIFLLNIFPLEIHSSYSVFWPFMGSAVCSGLVGPLLLNFFHYLGILIGGSEEDDSGNGLFV